MKKITLLLAVLFAVLVHAQDTITFSRELPEVTISQPLRVIFGQAGTRTDTTDSTITRLHPAGNLSDVLGTSISLKSYGPGGLSTMAMRGANSMQTPVIWQGINLQNVNNNTVDLSLLPAFLFDNVNVMPGGSSAGFGSGAIGGVINVNSAAGPADRDWDHYRQFNMVRVVNESGSFGTYMTGVQLAMARKQSRVDVRAYRQQAQNNFTFRNTGMTGQPLDTLEHAAFVQQGFMAQYNYKYIHRHYFSTALWVQETQREIPPTMLQISNEATQHDYALRWVADYHYTGRSSQLISARCALIHEGLLYNEGYTIPASNTDAWTAIAEADYMRLSHGNFWLWRRMKFYGGINFTESYSGVTEFIDHSNQWRSSVFASLSKLVRKNDQFNLMLREEIVDGRAVEPVGSMSYYFAFKKLIGLRGNIAHSYRIPTFNDLYWSPGGNPDLKAETAWTEELSAEFRYDKNRTAVEYILTVYNRNVKNMITWVPLAAYWSPVNVASVWSRGAEHRLKVRQSFGDLKFTLIVNADYVRSTYEKTDDPNDVAIGKQLIYVPAWFGSASFTGEFKGIYLTATESYTDLRFTTRDHLEWLPSYYIADVSIGYYHSFSHGNFSSNVNFFFRCNNLTDVHYQSVAWRPMPGRNFTLGLSIQFIKNRPDYHPATN